MLQAFYRYKDGILPNAGGWRDQSALLLDSISCAKRLEASIIDKDGK